MENYPQSSLLEREITLIGAAGVEKLSSSRVFVAGLGGVGSFAVEALARAGIGKMTLLDSDRIEPSNLNRQLFADLTTIGMLKTEAAKKRIEKVNPFCELTLTSERLDTENAPELIGGLDYDYVADCIDDVRAKIALAVACKEKNIPFLSCLGTGNKLDPTRFSFRDIFETDTCPLAKAVRAAARKAGIEKMEVLFSDEPPIRTGMRKPSSISFVPPVAGMLIASRIVRRILETG